MDSLIAEQHGLKSTADELAEARFELRNAKALADKLQTLLDSKTHQVNALHKEVENLGATLKAANNSAGYWKDRAEAAAHEPDIDTVPLADLLEAVGTYLEHDQAVTIRGSFEPTRQVEIHALGLTFSVDTHEASEALTKLQELGGCLVQEA